MRCQRCGKEVSPLRQLTDRLFCSELCKKKGPRASASILRDMEFEEDPFWKGANSQTPKQQSKTSNATLAGLVVGLMVAMVAARYYFPEPPSGPNPLASNLPSAQPSLLKENPSPVDAPVPQWISWLQSKLPGDKPLRVHSDFEGQLKDWAGAAAGWSVQGGTAHPGRLRLWKPTLSSKNYTMEFSGSVQKKALSWAFRAQDPRNYYATKIVIVRPGEVSGSNIIRYGVLDSNQFARTELPIPVALKANHPYLIQVRVTGAQFATLIDGNVVDRWTDRRIASGGVGFFSDEGEASAIDWAEFRERKGWLTSLISANLFIPPGAGL